MQVIERGRHSRPAKGEIAMAVQYDPNVIQQHAASLYARASRIVFTSGFLGFIAGAVAGSMFGAAMKSGQGFFVVLGLLVGTLVGVSIGRGRAFVLQLQAQSALCQVAIEANTRRAVEVASSTARPASTGHLSQVG